MERAPDGNEPGTACSAPGADLEGHRDPGRPSLAPPRLPMARRLAALPAGALRLTSEHLLADTWLMVTAQHILANLLLELLRPGRGLLLRARRA